MAMKRIAIISHVDILLCDWTWWMSTEKEGRFHPFELVTPWGLTSAPPLTRAEPRGNSPTLRSSRSPFSLNLIVCVTWAIIPVQNGCEHEAILRPDREAAVRRKLQFLRTKGQSCSHRERGVPLRNDHQGLHSDERAAQSLLDRGPRHPGCALQPVRTSGRTCVKV